MNAAFSSFHQNLVNSSTAYFGEPIIYQGSTFQAVVNDVRLEYETADGGFVQDLASQIVVAKSQGMSKPTSGETVIVNSLSMRVKDVTEDEVSYTFTCITATK